MPTLWTLLEKDINRHKLSLIMGTLCVPEAFVTLTLASAHSKQGIAWAMPPFDTSPDTQIPFHLHELLEYSLYNQWELCPRRSPLAKWTQVVGFVWEVLVSSVCIQVIFQLIIMPYSCPWLNATGPTMCWNMWDTRYMQQHQALGGSATQTLYLKHSEWNDLRLKSCLILPQRSILLLLLFPACTEWPTTMAIFKQYKRYLDNVCMVINTDNVS